MQKRRQTRSYSVPTVSPLPLLIMALAAFGVLIAAGLYLISAQSITINIGNQRTSTRTHQTTVRAALTEAGISPEKEDFVTPELDSSIHDGLIVTIDKAHPVIIDADGQVRRILTHKTAPRDILLENAISLSEHDVVQTDEATPPTYIHVIRALTVTLADGSQTRTLITTARTVGEALAEAKIALYVADAVAPDTSAALSDKTTITIRRSIPITIHVDGRTLVTRTHGATVGAALAEAGVALVGLDSSDPPAEQPIQLNSVIRVVRVTEADEVQRTETPFKRITQPDPKLDLDVRQVIQPGQVGVQEIHVRVRHEDGVEVSRSAPLSWTVQAPRDEIVAVGTRVVLHSLDTPTGPVQYWRVIKMRAASYKPASTGKATTDPQYGVTASGQKLQKGIVAVDPVLIPLGTHLYIPKYGEAVAGDTGGGVSGAMIDLGYSDSDYAEWSGTVDVYLLAPAPPADQIPLLPEDS